MRDFSKGYGIVYISVLTNNKLSIGSKALYGYIKSLENSPESNPTDKEIAKDLNCNIRTLKRYMKELTDNDIFLNESPGLMKKITWNN